MVRAGYKLTEVGIIPEDWDTPTLREHATFRTGPFGSAIHKSDYISDGIPIVNPMHLSDGQIKPSSAMTVSTDVAKRLNDYCLNSGELIIGRRGEMGRCAIVQPQQSGWLCGTGSMIIRPKRNLYAPYLQRVLASPPFVAQIENTSVGSTMINLNQGTLGNLRIPFPTREGEQQAIADALSDADALIESLAQLLTKKRQIKQGAMQDLLSSKRRLPGYHKPWKLSCLGEIGSFFKGRGIKRNETLDYGLPCIRYGEIYTRYNNYTYLLNSCVNSDVASRSQKIIYGDILFAGSGETAEEIGKCVAYIGTGEAYAGGDIVILRPAGQNPIYLGHLLNSPPVAHQKAKLGQGDAVVHIHGRNLAAVKILLPECSEQDAIASALFAMDTELEALEAQLTKARQIKLGMMQELLTGRIRLL